MDFAFIRRAERMLSEPRPAELDHGLLVAALSAQQSASATARAQARFAKGGAPARQEERLTELLLAGPAWREAARGQAGCFNRVRPSWDATPRKPD